MRVLLIGALAGAVALWAAKQRDVLDLSALGQSVQSAGAAAVDTVYEVIGMRGIRNNNPGNIRHSGERWQGMSAQQTDAAFVQFVSPEYGIRAMSRILDNYADRYGLRTVRGIIGRWAPAVENNTASYVQAVSNALAVSPDQAIDVKEKKVELIAAIIKHENGRQPYQVATINAGVMLA